MSVSSDSTGTIDDGRALLSSIFLEFCAKVRNNDPSILPELGQPFKISRLSEEEDMELADALLENTSVTYLELETEKYTKSSVEAMAKYVRTSKRLQRIRWDGQLYAVYLELQHANEILCCFMSALQESNSLKKLDINFPFIAGPSNLAFANMLAHTQGIRSLTLICPVGGLDGTAVAAARSGLKKNTTLRELTLECWRSATTVSPIFTSLRDHPLLQRLVLCGNAVDLTGLDTVLLSDNSIITELDIHKTYGGPSMMGLTRVLQALGRRPTLTKLGLHGCPLGRDEARLLQMALGNIPNLQSLVLSRTTLGSTGLTELGPALYRDTSIQVLDISSNNLIDMESAEILRDILRSNKTLTTLDLSGNAFGQTTGAVDYIVEGLGSNSTLMKIDLASCDLGDGGVSTLTQTLGSRNTTIQKLRLGGNSITSMGVGVLLETISHITDLDLQHSPILYHEGASLVARSLGNNALPNLTHLSLSQCGIGDDEFSELVSSLEQNISLLELDLRHVHGFNERTFLALAESLPEIKVLQRLDLNWCTGLASAMSLLLAGLRKNSSLFRFQVAGCAPSSVPPSPEETFIFAGGWMQEMECVGYRNRFLPLIRAPTERLPARGLWPHALARAASLPDVIFEVLRSKPKLVPSEDREGEEEAGEDTGIPKKRRRSDE